MFLPCVGSLRGCCEVLGDLSGEYRANGRRIPTRTALRCGNALGFEACADSRERHPSGAVACDSGDDFRRERGRPAQAYAFAPALGESVASASAHDAPFILRSRGEDVHKELTRRRRRVDVCVEYGEGPPFTRGEAQDVGEVCDRTREPVEAERRSGGVRTSSAESARRGGLPVPSHGPDPSDAHSVSYRSWLFVPGDSPAKMEKGLADAEVRRCGRGRQFGLTEPFG